MTGPPPRGLFSLSIHSLSGGITGRHRERYGRPRTETFELDDAKATGIATRLPRAERTGRAEGQPQS